MSTYFPKEGGVHHVHHLCSRSPSYRLPQGLRDHPELRDFGRLTLIESFRCVHLVLWDETQRRLVPFRNVCREPNIRPEKTLGANVVTS